MTFLNTAVDLQSLPAAEDVVLQPAHPAYKKVLRTEWAITLLCFTVLAIVCIVVFPFFRQPAGWIILLVGFTLIGLLYYLWIEKSFPFLAFAIRDKDILLQSGWLIRTVKHCPFNRIQNCSVQSGPLERRLGLASLVIYTAGSGGADLRVRGLLQENADRLRHFILETIHQEPNADS